MMTDSLDLTALPEDARMQAADFYDFLKAKYVGSRKTVRQIDWKQLVPRNVPVFEMLKREA